MLTSTTLWAGPWHTLAAKGSEQAQGEVRAKAYHLLDADDDYLQQLYDGMRVVQLPLPDGGFVNYKLEPYSLLPEDLAERYPELLTFKGVSLDNPEEEGRFDVGPNGFHGMFVYQGRHIFVDSLGDGRYASYYQKDARSSFKEAPDQVLQNTNVLPQIPPDEPVILHRAGTLRTYTIAISATGEYTKYFGGTKEKALNAITTLLNRVNQVFRRDLGVELTLASGNDALIFTDPATDPFTNSTKDMNINATVQGGAVKALQIGAYDVGHVLTTQGGGLAVLGALGTADRSKGMTGTFNPTGDAFFIDYVAHELGHQFGADHSFNGTTGSCGGGNRNGFQAWEPGSGSTIMSYAGLCGNENIQSFNSPYFHSKSIEQIERHLAAHPDSGSSMVVSNKAPSVNAGGDFAIPAATPFTLQGSGSDPDGDKLEYSWEQVDLGSASDGETMTVDDGTRPLFRVMAPTSSPDRTLPAMANLLKGTLAKGEVWPERDRTMLFRLIARDNRGGIGSDDVAVRVISSARFYINPPAGNALAEGKLNQVSWNVGGSDGAPISCSSVNISMTSDKEGKSWQPLATGVANSGSANVAIPAGVKEAAWLKVACSDNRFFAVSPVLTISDDPNIIVGPPLEPPKPPTPPPVDSGSSGGGGGGSLGWFSLLLMGVALWRRTLH